MLYLPYQDDCKTRRDKNKKKQNIEQLHIPTTEAYINNKSTTTEPPPKNGQQPKPPGGGGGWGGG